MKRKIMRNVYIKSDTNGNKYVFIKENIFWGKRNIKWNEVKKYLKQYVGRTIHNLENDENIYVSTDFPYEYKGSVYHKKLDLKIAKVKANASQAIPEMIEIAKKIHFKSNEGLKHKKTAKNGWYLYNTRFSVPVYDGNDEIIRHNLYNCNLLIRHAQNGHKFLYDIQNIKKETSTPLGC